MSDRVRDLRSFVLWAMMPALAISTLFALHSWPTGHPSQADALGFGLTAGYLAAGLLGVVLARQIGCGRVAASPGRTVVLALAVGVAVGTFDLALERFTPWGEHVEALNRAAGYTWANVALPWSLPHYLHASILSECAFRLFAIVVPAWLMLRLLKGRFEAQVFWSFAVLAAWIEPLIKAIAVRKLPLFGMTPLETAVNLFAVAEQLLFAWMLRRYGWSAPILARFGYYLLVRVFIGYLYPPDSIMYPGPH